MRWLSPVAVVLLAACEGKVVDSPPDGGDLARDAGQDGGSVSLSDAGLGDLVISSPLALDHATVTAGETLGGSVTFHNRGTAAISVQALRIRTLAPGASHGAGPFDDLTPSPGATTVAPGQSVTITSARAFGATDPLGGWVAYAAYQDAAGAWHDGPDTAFTVAAAAQTDGGAPGLHVSGNQLVDAAGNVVRLTGVNRSGTEYMCIGGYGFFDGPNDDASIQAIASWKANAVRIPLNEDCWLDLNTPAGNGGAAYQAAIADYVQRVTNAGLAAIVELHWNAPGTGKATGQQPMPDRDHSVTFWTQVANAFKGNGMVVFDLYNEPYPDSNQDTQAAWDCWLNGGTCPGVSFTAAGMQELVTAVRGTGSRNVIILGGVTYSNSLTGWLSHKPSDPTGNLGASWHVYNFNYCASTTCYDQEAGPVAAQVPIVADEVGDDNCNAPFLDGIMGWLDAHGQSYLAWTWDTWGTSCSSIALVSDYAGTPTSYGQIFKTHLAAVHP